MSNEEKQLRRAEVKSSEEFLEKLCKQFPNPSKPFEILYHALMHTYYLNYYVMHPWVHPLKIYEDFAMRPNTDEKGFRNFPFRWSSVR